ncbi:hypothetical protein [Streptomyces sp. NPDC014676]|uniref:hypothetical protein n=1 Tax=Streptomyces sp. NPDC014676 TaxID=3364879 RepID=UPI0036F5D656
MLAHSNHGDAIQSFAHDSRRNGVFGNNDAKAPAPSGGAPAGNGVFGFTEVPNASGVCGAIPASNTKGAGVTGIGRTAGRFFGNVEVTGDLVLTGADVAEQFDVAERLNTADEVGPGTVVVLNDKGALAPCTQAYDSCVAGVVSGAGDRVPALVLDRKEYPEGREDAWRRAVAVVGKVWCRANASSRPILVGDLLTTSTTLGHAMAAVDRDAAFGAVLGKALTPLASGTGLVLVLVGLG